MTASSAVRDIASDAMDGTNCQIRAGTSAQSQHDSSWIWRWEKNQVNVELLIMGNTRIGIKG